MLGFTPVTTPGTFDQTNISNIPSLIGNNIEDPSGNSSEISRIPRMSNSNNGSHCNGEYYVMVHVDAGETFSVRVGEQIQHIPGPATVRMVSNSGPPLPMPMQVPPGHLVQQIVDEEGILTHVILSPYPSNPSPSAMLSILTGQPGDPLAAPVPNVVLNSMPHLQTKQPPHMPHSHSVNESLIQMTPFGQTHGHGPRGVLGPPFQSHYVPLLHPYMAQYPSHLNPPPPPSHYHYPHFHQYPINSAPSYTTTVSSSPTAQLNVGGKLELDRKSNNATNGTVKDLTESSCVTTKMSNDTTSNHSTTKIPVENFKEVAQQSEVTDKLLTDVEHANGVRSVSPVKVQSDECNAQINNVESVNGFDLSSAITSTTITTTTTTTTTTSTTTATITTTCTTTTARICQKEIITSAISTATNVTSAINATTNTSNLTCRSMNNNTTTTTTTTTTTIANLVDKKLSVVKPTKSANNSKFKTSTSTDGDVTLKTNNEKLDSSVETCHNLDKSTDGSFVQSSYLTGKNYYLSNYSNRRRGRRATNNFSLISSMNPHVKSNHNYFYNRSFNPTTNTSRSDPISTDLPIASSASNGPPLSNCLGSLGSLSTSDQSTENVKIFDQYNALSNDKKTHFKCSSDSDAIEVVASTSTATCSIPTVNQSPINGYSTANTSYYPSHNYHRHVSQNQHAHVQHYHHPHSNHNNHNSHYNHSHNYHHSALSYLGSNHDSSVLNGHDCLAKPSSNEVGDQHSSELDSEWEHQTVLIRDLLSTVRQPQVSEIKPNSALIQLSLPDDLLADLGTFDDSSNPNPDLSVNGKNADSSCGGAPTDTHDNSMPDYQTAEVTKNVTELKKQSGKSLLKSDDCNANCSTAQSLLIDPDAVQFELHLGERENSTNFNCVFIGEATCILMQDLRPASNYYIKVCCVYCGIRGEFSRTAHFVTLPSKPSTPRTIQVIGRTRNSLHVKWGGASENGSRITSYRLEYTLASSTMSLNDSHVEKETNADFTDAIQVFGKSYKINQLTSSTEYLFRVAAVNQYGQSPWSTILSASTSGSPPATPHPPFLIQSGVHSLTLGWRAPELSNNGTTTTDLSSPTRTNAIGYILEMDDQVMQHRFVTVFDGHGTEHCVTNLRRDTKYRFRLAASNVDGRSKWSDVVTLFTLPDRPSEPKNLHVIGSVQPTQVAVTWEPPDDDGGIPVDAYRLEILLPYTINSQNCSDVKQSLTNDFLISTDSFAKLDLHKIPVCIPKVTTLSRNNYVSNDSSQAIWLDQVESVNLSAVLNCQSVDALSSPHSFNNMAKVEPTCSSYSNCCHVSEFEADVGTKAKLYQSTWFVIYQGIEQTVVVENLQPGLTIEMRVRARSTSPHLKLFDFWGLASNPILRIAIPAIPPSQPTNGPRLIGKAKSNSLKLCWSMPKDNGGSPILSYDIWQVVLDGDSWSSGSSWSDLYSNNCNDSSFACSLNQSKSLSAISLIPKSLHNVHLDQAVRLRSTSVHDIGSKSKALTNCESTGNRIACCDNVGPGHVVCSVRKPQCHLFGLKSGSKYGFRVRARNCAGHGVWTDLVEMTTPLSLPGPPKNLPRLFAKSAHCIHVAWDAVRSTKGAKIIKYRLECQYSHTKFDFMDNQSSMNGSDFVTDGEGQSGNFNFQMVYEGKNLSSDVKNLQAASVYNFRVCAVNVAGAGSWSSVVSCVTHPAPPDQPYGLSIYDLGPLSVRVLWVMSSSNGSPISSFVLELNNLSEKDTVNVFEISAPYVITHSSNDSNPASNCIPTHAVIDYSKDKLINYSLTKLKPLTNYALRIQAVNKFGPSPYSASIEFQTLVPLPGVPTFTSITHVTSVSLRLEWDVNVQTNRDQAPDLSNDKQIPSVYNKFDYYTLQLSKEDDSEWFTIYEGKENYYKINRLTENTTYQVRVRATNETGYGSFSPIQTVTTLKSSPPSIRGLKILDLGPDRCQIEWSPINPMDRDPIIYILYLLAVSGTNSKKLTNQNQVYRGSQPACCVTGLMPNCEYVCRVCAVRLCQPSKTPTIVRATGNRLDNGLSAVNDTTVANGEHVLDESPDQLVDFSSDYQITELVGPYSSGLIFTTPDQFCSTSHPNLPSDSGDLTMAKRGFVSAILSSINIGQLLTLPWNMLRSHSAFVCSRCNSTSTSTKVIQQQSNQLFGVGISPVNTAQSLSSPLPPLPSSTSSPLSTSHHPVSSQTDNASLTSRRRFNMSTSQQQQQQPRIHNALVPNKPSNHLPTNSLVACTGSSRKYSHRWCRLSDHQLACLLLVLFGLASLLVAMGLQYMLALHLKLPNDDEI